MAEVGHRLGRGRGAYDFAHKIYNCHLLGSPNRQGKGAIHVSAGFLTGYLKKDDLLAAGNAVNRVTDGASRDGYTSVTPVPGAVDDMWGKGNVPKDCSLQNKTRGRIIGRNAPLCRSNVGLRRTLCSSSLYQWRLCWGRGQFVFIREYGDNGSRAVPLFKSKTGYYEILQVMPSATQAQIKTAYYKQSFVYHPDRNAGSEEATVRFSDISEAYTVLGNETLRKKYDRGLLGQSDLLATVRPSSSKDGAGGGSAQQQAGGRRSVGGEGPRANDFDKFFRSHYNEQLQRQRDIRARREQRLREKAATKDGQKLDWMMEMCVGLLVVMAAGVIMSLKRG
ncbi:hypothetical protein F2P81_003491 [Scophthalmus maximus]|uniref:J domain-containing protein n=1 Tax=Scophthalmus maximus TaxID=52904 RepID=A0A6A4TED1_SCOMX|nr:hypothetical protein F2P81_003491 [Scophthalmus maximus]